MNANIIRTLFIADTLYEHIYESLFVSLDERRSTLVRYASCFTQSTMYAPVNYVIRLLDLGMWKNTWWYGKTSKQGKSAVRGQTPSRNTT